MQICGDAHVCAQLLDGGDGCIGGFHIVHLIDAHNAHGLADGAVALTGNALVVLQTHRQQDGAGHTVRGVVQSGQAVCHGVDDAQTHIGESHAGDVLAQSHALAAFRGVLHSAAQALADELDGFQMEHIGDDAVALGDVAMVDSKNLVMEGSYNAAPISVDEMWAWLEKYAAIFKDYICDVGQYLADADAAGKKVLFEAQLGALRDIDFGIYPYTTSSNVIGAYAPIGAGIPGHKLNNSIGVMKAYSSCVGDGPFAAELAMTEEEKHALREAGHEYGAATGRPRRVGPIDLVASRYGVFCQGCDEVALTLLDVLDYMEKIPMVTAYKLTDGTTTTRFPMGEALDTAQPVVEYLPGWHCDITAARKWEDLPKEAQDYVEYLEKAVGCKITYISVGAEREAYIHRV